MNNPLVSVVIPTYNRAHLIRETIDSVLTQPFIDLELIVVDDGSTDNTEEVIGAIADPRLKYLSQPNRGPAAARNAGIQAALGEYVAFLDSDDHSLPDRFTTQMEVVERDTSVGLVYSLFYNIRKGGMKKLSGQCYPPDSQLLPEGPRIYLPTTLIRRQWLDQIGGFDEELWVGEDMDLIWRLWMAGCRMTCVPRPLTLIHREEVSLSTDFHHYVDHMMASVNKIFRDPRMPAEMLPLRGSVQAKMLIIPAASAYMAANPQMGRDILERAITLDPPLANQNIDVLTSRFVNRVIGHSDDPEAVMRLLMRYPLGGKTFQRRFERHAWHQFNLIMAFEAYQSGQRLECMRYATRALVSKFPSTLRNRGLLSILIRALIRKHSFKPFGKYIANNKTSN